MKIIQTLWSGTSDNLLTASLGWVAPEYHIMSWALSCLQLCRFYENVILYTDSKSARLLIDTLKLPYTNVVCDLDKLNHYHKDLWALSKIDTYNKQETPFLHVDGDVFIWKEFDKIFLSNSLIAQNKEVSTTFSERLLSSLEKTLPYFPDEIKEERKNHKKIYDYNAGIIGGSDIDFFKEYSNKSFEFVNKNINYLNNASAFNFNIIFEQYLFYCMAKKQQKKVAVLFEGLFLDRGYKDFAEFTEVPYSRDYLHLMGGFKKSTDTCIQMAKRLRADYPECYYNIIQLFKTKNIYLKKDYYYFLPTEQKNNYLKRYNALKNQPVLPALGNPKKIKNFFYWRTDYVNLFINFLDKKFISFETANSMMDDVKNLETQIEFILQKKFASIDNSFLYQRDLKTDAYNQQIFTNEQNIHNTRLTADTLFEIRPVIFDWTILNENKPPYRKLFKKISKTESENNHIAIIPQCHEEGYSILHLGEIDLLILELLKEHLSIRKLLQEIEVFFDAEELKQSYLKFQSLIYYRIKILVVNNLVKPIDN